MPYIYPKLFQARQVAKRKGLPLPYSSEREGKKLYVIYCGKKIHFGSRYMSDFLIHKDEERRQRYRKRHEAIKLKDGSFAYKNKNQPSYYAYNILW